MDNFNTSGKNYLGSELLYTIGAGAAIKQEVIEDEIMNSKLVINEEYADVSGINEIEIQNEHLSQTLHEYDDETISMKQMPEDPMIKSENLKTDGFANNSKISAIIKNNIQKCISDLQFCNLEECKICINLNRRISIINEDSARYKKLKSMNNYNQFTDSIAINEANTPPSYQNDQMEFKKFLNLPEHTHMPSWKNIYSFTMQDGLKHYVEGDEGINFRVQCSYCGNRFCITNVLNAHKHLQTAEKPYQCPYCDKLVYFEFSLSNGVFWPIQCSECRARFRDLDCFNLHLQAKHSYSQCENVSKQKKKVEDAKERFPCSLCDKKFSYRCFLEQHMLFHTGKKPFKCVQCDKAFTTKSYLNKHKAIHTGEKSYECLQCGKKFIMRSTLSQHKLVHIEEKPYECMRCGRKFSRKSSLKYHESVHSGERPHKCLYCTKQFTQRNALEQHNRIHTGEKPCVCLQCDKKFRTSSSLKRHQAIHNRKKSCK